MADSKEIEEKALNYFKTFIEDSQIVSQYLAENDKELCWDGSLCVFEEGYKNVKTHFIDKIPTQIKGKEVKYFKNKFSYPIEVADLKAYLHSPTLYVVCQEKVGTKERKLFYRCLLPETIKHILQGKNKQQTISVKMTTMPNLDKFEEELKLFIGNRRRQIGFADKKSISISDLTKRGVRNFSFVAPRPMGQLELMNYLSQHPTFMYAKIDDEFDIEVPVAGGPATLIFKNNLNQVIRVGERVFFEKCQSIVDNGEFILKGGDFLTLTIPLDEQMRKCSLNINGKGETLDEAIFEAEFILAVFDTKKITVGESEFDVKVGDKEQIDNLRGKLEQWRELKKLLEILHVNKPLLLKSITKEHEAWIRILEDCIIYKKIVRIPNVETSVVKVVIGNLQLIVWCSSNKKGECLFGDFFDAEVKVCCQFPTPYEATQFSYLREDNLWGTIDNIPYNEILCRSMALKGKHEHVYDLLVQDVLAMLMAADNVEDTDADRTKILLEKAEELNTWIYEQDEENAQLHQINAMQIIHRKRAYNETEISELKAIMNSQSIDITFRLAACALLDDKVNFYELKNSLTDDDFNAMQWYAMQRYIKEMLK